MRAILPLNAASPASPKPAAMVSMEAPMPLKLSERSCLRPNLSMREAATIVPRTARVSRSPALVASHPPLFNLYECSTKVQPDTVCEVGGSTPGLS